MTDLLPAPDHLDETPRGWQALAACAGIDPSLFFTERGEPVADAKAVCARCPVRLVCLEHALEHGEKFGIWGGLSERERRIVRRTRPGARHRPPPS